MFFAQNINEILILSAKYGYLYNGYCITDNSENFIAGLHVPSFTEFELLLTYLKTISVDPGGMLKEIGTDKWFPSNMGATNEFNFNAIPSGKRLNSYYATIFNFINEYAYFWANTISGSSMWCYYLSGVSTKLTRATEYLDAGQSIRCMRELTTQEQTNYLDGEIVESCIDGDNNSYDIIKIGTQGWSNSNLKTTTYLDGLSIRNITDADEWANVKDTELFGLIYNWAAVSHANFGITDWEIPLDTDWQTLVTTSGGSGVAGGVLKLDNDTVWDPNNILGAVQNGFDGVGGGYEYNGFGGQKSVGYYVGKIFMGVYRPSVLYLYRYSDNTDILAPGTAYSFCVRLIYKGTGTPASTVTDIDGNVYNVILIGTQYWLKENFKCKHLTDSTAITNITENMGASSTPAWAKYDNIELKAARCAYDNDETNV